MYLMVGWPAKRFRNATRGALVAPANDGIEGSPDRASATVLPRGHMSPRSRTVHQIREAVLLSVRSFVLAGGIEPYGPGSAVASMRTGLPAPSGRPTIAAPGRRPSIVVETESNCSPAVIVVSPKRSE